MDLGESKGSCCVTFCVGAGSPFNTVWPGPRHTFIPSGILIHQAAWPQYTSLRDRQDRQWSDSIDRDVNEILAYKTETRLRRLFFGPRRDQDQDLARPRPRRFYSTLQCSHCKRCISYGNSVRLSVRHTPVLCQNDGT